MDYHQPGKTKHDVMYNYCLYSTYSDSNVLAKLSCHFLCHHLLHCQLKIDSLVVKPKINSIRNRHVYYNSEAPAVELFRVFLPGQMKI